MNAKIFPGIQDEQQDICPRSHVVWRGVRWRARENGNDGIHLKKILAFILCPGKKVVDFRFLAQIGQKK